MNSLYLQLEPEDDVVYVTVAVLAGRFSGVASPSFRTADLAAFAEHLNAYPLGPGILVESDPELSGPRRYASITIRPYNSTGMLLVAVQLRTEDSDEYVHEPLQVSACFTTTYSQLGSFQKSLSGVLMGKGSRALLEGL